jgi:hypothetical protein
MMQILHHNGFKMVNWEVVYKTLKKVPKLFQLWASKQVMGTVGMMEWDKLVVRKCPSCMQAWDTCAHVLFCQHAGCVKIL